MVLQSERKLSICELTTKRQGFERDVVSYKEFGIDGISLWWDTLDAYGPEKAARFLKAVDLPAVSIVGAPFLVNPENMSAGEAFDEVLRILDVCSTVGADVLGVVPGNRRGLAVAEMERRTMDVLARLAPEAEVRNVTLALEPIHVPYFDFLNTLVDADRLVREVNHSAVKILFDVWHLCHEPELYERIEETIDKIGFVHFSDWREPTRCHDDRLIPGEGVLPLREILRTLDRCGYRGFYDVEIFSEEVWLAPPEKVLASCRQFFDSVWQVEEGGAYPPRQTTVARAD
jgi:sugar phosphate isomerase/epimerase